MRNMGACLYLMLHPLVTVFVCESVLINDGDIYAVSLANVSDQE